MNKPPSSSYAQLIYFTVRIATRPFLYTLIFKTVPQPLPHSPQSLPPYPLILIRHKLHNPSLQADLLQLAPLLGHFFDQPAHIIASDRKHLLIILPLFA